MAGGDVILDPKTTFHVPEDQKVIVSFQWLGAAGKHHMTGTWKGPGGTSSTSGFDYVAQDREFGGYWSLPLNADVPDGAWTFEAQVDGVDAGSFPFAIVHGAGPAAAPGTAASRALVPLTRQEMFAHALAATATVEGLDSTGKSLRKGPATIIDGDTLVTAFSVINGAASVRVRVGTAPVVEIGDVLAWDRRLDWVMLRRSGLGAASAPEHAPASTGVGSACVTVGSAADGAFAVTTGDIVGVNEYPDVGTRLSVSLYNGRASPGAPVLDEFGRLIGVISAGLYPGTGVTAYRIADLGAPQPTLIVPLAALSPPAGTAPVLLADLATRGLFTAPVTLARDVMSGGFATGIQRNGPATQPVDQKAEFSARDSNITVFVNWNPSETLKGLAVVHVYDISGLSLGETKPLKINLRSGALAMSSWSFSVPTVEGVYRADVIVGTEIAWRGYFHVVK